MSLQQMLLGAGGGGTVTGQVTFEAGEGATNTVNTYNTTWTVPAGVTSISVLCIGRGGKGESGYYGGAGGSLTWLNDIEVNPGDTYNIYVCGGYDTEDNFPNAPYQSDELWQVGSRFKGTNSNTSRSLNMVAYAADRHLQGLVGGASGQVSYNPNISGSVPYNTYHGGTGGLWATHTSWGTTTNYYGAGGGCAGYEGDGGNGGYGYVSGSTNGDNPESSSGGGAGGYSAWRNSSGNSSGQANSMMAGAGGGTGIYGKGSDGAKPAANSEGDAGQGGSGGYPTNNSTSTGVPSGGYGGGSADYTTGHASTNQGGRGCVRIIWPGDSRQYPNTLTTDQ
jgi:hypothetical protein